MHTNPHKVYHVKNLRNDFTEELKDFTDDVIYDAYMKLKHAMTTLPPREKYKEFLLKLIGLNCNMEKFYESIGQR